MVSGNQDNSLSLIYLLHCDGLRGSPEVPETVEKILKDSKVPQKPFVEKHDE